jgi:hypothetical protein
MGSLFKNAGSELGDSADKLDELMQQVKLTSDQENKLSGAAAAHTTRQRVSRALIQMPRSRPLMRCLTAYPKLRMIWSTPTTSYQTWPNRSVYEACNMPSLRAAPPGASPHLVPRRRAIGKSYLAAPARKKKLARNSRPPALR